MTLSHPDPRSCVFGEQTRAAAAARRDAVRVPSRPQSKAIGAFIDLQFAPDLVPHIRLIGLVGSRFRNSTTAAARDQAEIDAVAGARRRRGLNQDQAAVFGASATISYSSLRPRHPAPARSRRTLLRLCARNPAPDLSRRRRDTQRATMNTNSAPLASATATRDGLMQNDVFRSLQVDLSDDYQGVTRSHRRSCRRVRARSARNAADYLRDFSSRASSARQGLARLRLPRARFRRRIDLSHAARVFERGEGCA